MCCFRLVFERAAAVAIVIQEDTTNSNGIDDQAGNAMVVARERDGMNKWGDEGRRKYHTRPYADYLGYKPVSTAYELKNPSRWQPGIITSMAVDALNSRGRGYHDSCSAEG